jgi:hypothetical protein
VERIAPGDAEAQPFADRGGSLSRRHLLKFGSVIAATALIPGAAVAALQIPYPPERMLKFYNLHTGESLSTVYCEKGCYVEGALKEVNYILRDFRPTRSSQSIRACWTCYIRLTGGYTLKSLLTLSPGIGRPPPMRCWRRTAKGWPATVFISRARLRTSGYLEGDFGRYGEPR